MFVAAVTAVMLLTEFMEVGISTTSKAAMTKGMSQFVYVVYSNALAIFILLPSSLIFYWKRTRPPLTLSIVFRIFLLGITSCSVQVFLNTGISYSSPTLSSAMNDLTPALTFLMAIISRMEELDFKLQSSQAKSIGTMVSIAGALTMTLYKGQPITGFDSLDDHLHVLLQSNWVIGGIFCTASAFCLAILYIVQTWIIRDYPAELIVTLISCIFTTILSAIVSVVAEKDPNAWKLELDIELIAIVVTAVFAVTIRNVVHTWACRKKGPVYTAMFKPMGMVIAILLGVSVLGDTLYVGSVIGAVIIAVGFYAVLWGKAQDEKMAEVEGNSNFNKSSSPEVPLLRNRSVEV